LVIAVDGSGSVRDAGFKILKSYTSTLLNRYQMQYFGQSAMKIGIVLFGNGIIMPDGKTVSPARNMQKLTGKMEDVKKAVMDLPFKKASPTWHKHSQWRKTCSLRVLGKMHSNPCF